MIAFSSHANFPNTFITLISSTEKEAAHLIHLNIAQPDK